ncbi:hypothetical protein Acy02nite_53240 [Actinoplanes cyaneus]|uniref:Uncharacterized protein n=1 Tax=Actinoplanes cyaneus TaxID=52696 RepID=A0A919IL70_9ACTN|nr:hypothetical protein Acy02nite_53240 [Actinoplanes cyaneus]
MTVALDGEQTVPLHAGDRLTDRGAALVQALGDASPKRRHAFFLEFENGPEIHLGGIDKVIHDAVLPAAMLPRGGGLTSAPSKCQETLPEAV